MDNKSITRAESVYLKLIDEFGFKTAKGKISFNMKDFSITVQQPNVVGNIIEEWLAKWMLANSIESKHNKSQSSPDFWLNLDDLNTEWLEVKSFTGSPNFDIAAFRSFINLIIDKPYKLQSSYLLIKYEMEENGLITIKDCWLKKVWEISSTSSKWPLKVQAKSGVINNIRPAIWYSDNTDFIPFESLEDFLSALEETIYRYHDTRHLADSWLTKVIESYKNWYGQPLQIPRWMDIKDKYCRQ